MLQKQRESYWYLASPYSHSDSQVREQRFNAVVAACGQLMRRNWLVLSPIAHSHPVAVVTDLPGDWAFWERIDRVFIQQSRGIIVLQLEGWWQSKGVSAEIEIAKDLGLPVHFVACDELGNVSDESLSRLERAIAHEAMTIEGNAAEVFNA